MFRKSLAMYVFTSLVFLILANLSFVRALVRAGRDGSRGHH